MAHILIDLVHINLIISRFNLLSRVLLTHYWASLPSIYHQILQVLRAAGSLEGDILAETLQFAVDIIATAFDNLPGVLFFPRQYFRYNFVGIWRSLGNEPFVGVFNSNAALVKQIIERAVIQKIRNQILP